MEISEQMMNDAVAREGFRSARTTRLDVLVFVAAFVIGVTVYFTLHFLQAPQYFQSGTIALVMAFYAAGVSMMPKLRIRLDQAGDNAYYLGLLFTLISMAVALYTFSFSGHSGAEQIISNFGIALSSTIMGIFLRIILNQMRVDPADVESMTRIELAEAARQMKVSMDSVTKDLGHFHKETQQRLADVISSVTEKYQDFMLSFTTEVSGATQKLLSETEGAQRNVLEKTGSLTEKLDAAAESARVSIDRLRTVEPPPLKMATRLNKVCESLEGLSKPIESITEAISNSERASSDALATIGKAAQELVELSRTSRAQQTETLEHIRAAARDFQTALAQAGHSLQQDKQLLQTLEVQARTSADQSKRAQDAANEVLGHLTGAVKQITTLVSQSTIR